MFCYKNIIKHMIEYYMTKQRKASLYQASNALFTHILNLDIAIAFIASFLQSDTVISLRDIHALEKQFFITSLIPYTEKIK